MAPEERDSAYLWDMLDAARDVVDFTRELSADQFKVEKVRRFAAERRLAVLGEASSRVSQEFQRAHPDIDWRQIAGLPSVLQRGYGETLIESLWKIVKTSIPRLVGQLEGVLPAPPREEPESKP